MEPEVSTNDILRAIQALDEKLTGRIDAVETGLEEGLARGRQQDVPAGRRPGRCFYGFPGGPG